MPEEEKKEEETQNIIKSLFIFGAIGIIIGISLTLFFNATPLTVLIVFTLFVFAGIIHYFTKSAGFAVLFIIAVVFIWLIVKFGISFSTIEFTGIGSFFKTFFSPLIQLFKGPEEFLYGETKEITTPDFQLNLDYENDYIYNGKIDLFVKLNLNNKILDSLEIYPYCYKKINNEPLLIYSLQAYSSDNHFKFPKSDKTLSTGFRCSGSTDYSSEKIIVGFRIPYTSWLGWKIYTSSEWREISEKKGTLITSENPYEFSIVLPSDMPLKNGEYDFFIKLRSNYDLELEEIKYIQFESSPDVDVSCEGFGKKIVVSKENLKKYWDDSKKEYVFNCKLLISEAIPILEQKIINLNANYIVYKELEKTLKKKE
ncbi:MAG: hypothetical protein QW622_00375 [Candidatus Pacearchaeota archaeon]